MLDMIWDAIVSLMVGFGGAMFGLLLIVYVAWAAVWIAKKKI